MDHGNDLGLQTMKRDPRNSSELGRSKFRSHFHRLWTKVHQIKYSYAE